MENMPDLSKQQGFRSSPIWIFVFAIWIVLFAVGVTLALALGIWNIWQAF